LQSKEHDEFRKRKRQRMQAYLSNPDKAAPRFEATRGNKFYKEWRLNKK